MNTFDITPILIGAVTIIAIIITAYLIPLIESKTTAAQRTELMKWVKIAVDAAEQIYRGPGRGKEKLQHALDFLESKNLKVDLDTLRNAIEAEVRRINAGMLFDE